MTVLRIVAAVLLPPLAVFLTRGLGRDFWIGVVLTLIAFLPGVAFASYVVLADRGSTPTWAT